MGLTQDDINKIVSELTKLPSVPPSQSRSYGSPAMKILDCILSLNRNFDSMVVKRIDAFEASHPKIKSLADLNSYIDNSSSKYNLFYNDLDYKDSERADLLNRTLKWLINEESKYKGTDETEKLKNWAISVNPQDFQYATIIQGVKIKISVVDGLGIAGWQYLRMLFGADTCKPDRHIKDFIKACIGRGIGEIPAIEALHAAAPLAGLTVREADRRIWKHMSTKAKQKNKSKKTGKSRHCN